MNNAVCCVAVSAVRAEPSHKSEMVTQQLFGDGVEVIGENKEWRNVRGCFDGYEGWCHFSHFTPVIDHIEQSVSPLIAGDWINVINLNGTEMRIPFGCDISIFFNPQYFITSQTFNFSGILWKDDVQGVFAERIVRTGMRFLNSAYLWGGKSVFGIDCSGFTQSVYKMLGIHLLRDASQQAGQGNDVLFEDSETGDLAFFTNEEGKITHVGILLDKHEIIHASGKVRIDLLDKEGITHKVTNQRTHRLTLIKRYF